jgi:hypothetical protein
LLDKRPVPAKNTAHSGAIVPPSWPENKKPEFMTTSRPSQPTGNQDKAENCNHPRVRIVAREEDAEFVECLECGDVFESSEFKDMQIEESKLKEN